MENIEPTEFSRLCQRVAAINSTLIEINLQKSGIGGDQAQQLAAALHNSSLTTLNLYNNEIGDEDAKAIAVATELARTAADRRLVEYFVVTISSVECHDKSTPSQAQNNSNIFFNDWKTDSGYDCEEEVFVLYPFKPTITARYPLYDHSDNPLHDNVVFFCHSSGKIQLRTEQVISKIYETSLTFKRWLGGLAYVLRECNFSSLVSILALRQHHPKPPATIICNNDNNHNNTPAANNNNTPLIAMEKEKKDQSFENVEIGETIKGGKEGGLATVTEDDPGSGDYSELPKELRGLKDRTFEFEEELEAEFVSRGFEDIPVILDPSTGKARLRMTTGAHDKVTNRYVKKFELVWQGQATAVDGTTNVFIQPAAQGRKIYARKPDIAFWGPDKIVTIVEDGVQITEPKDLTVPLKRHKSRDQVERVNPDVVFQFSWTNADAYEEQAIDDMMNRAVVTPTATGNPNNSAPRLGYLLRLGDDRKKLSRMDVYRIPRGATVQDAIAGSNGATKETYTPGGNDVVIAVTAQDLGIPVGQPAPPYFCASNIQFFVQSLTYR